MHFNLFAAGAFAGLLLAFAPAAADASCCDQKTHAAQHGQAGCCDMPCCKDAQEAALNPASWNNF